MTLIAAFRGDLGTAICADTQETCPSYDVRGNVYELRKTVQKISPIKIGKYQIAICGSGHATLIEAFIVRAERSLRDVDAIACTPENPAGVAAIHKALEDELERFYARDVVACQDQDKTIKLFIAACCPIAQEYALWVSENTVLREARSPELIGWEHELYSETANRFCVENMTVSQAVLASIHTLTLAKQTSNYVGGPLTVAVVDKNGIWIEDDSYVRKMEERLREYESKLNRLFLSCADTTISIPTLEDYLAQFRETVLALHREHIDQQALATNLEDMFEGRGQRKLPKGPITFKADGKLHVEHDRAKILEAKKKWKIVKALGATGPIKLTVNCECSSFQVVLANLQSLNVTREFKCPNCGNMAVVGELDADDVSFD